MNIGKLNRLSVKRIDHDQIWLVDDDGVEIPLLVKPQSIDRAEDTSAIAPGTELEVFIYTSASGQPMASLTVPSVFIHQTAMLKVVSRSEAGLWLDWGLDQDLLLPKSEMAQPIHEDQAFVYVFLDASNRLCASTRFHRFLLEHTTNYKRWDKVQLVIAAQTRLGFKAIIDNEYLGLLYADEVFSPLKTGDRVEGFIKAIRDDNRIDLTLYPERTTIKDELGQRILADLTQWGGTSTLTDRSKPEEIQAQYQVSKKNYKRALSSLYKARLIEISDDQIKLVQR